MSDNVKEIVDQCMEIIHKAGMAGCVVVNQDDIGQYETTMGCHSNFQKIGSGELKFAGKDKKEDEVYEQAETDIHNLRAVEHGLDVARDHVKQMRQSIQELFFEEAEQHEDDTDVPPVVASKGKNYDVN